MIKFEEHEGQLFCMLEEPVPLQLDSPMPCVVRYIQDCSPMGRYMRRKYAMVINTVAIARRIGTDGRAYSWDEFFVEEAEVLEIIGYPVAEGSKEWALYRLMQGDIVMGQYREDDAIVTPISKGWHEVIKVGSYGKIHGAPITDNDFLFHAEKIGWQIYEEPEPQYKVGDWVEWCGDQYMVESAPPQSGGHYDIRSPYDELGCSVYPENITRKLDPSEIVVKIGCLEGTVEDLSYADNGRFFLVGKATERHPVGIYSILYDEMLDATTRELVEGLFKKQNEEK